MIFKPKHTTVSVANDLIEGLTNGTIYLVSDSVEETKILQKNTIKFYSFFAFIGIAICILFALYSLFPEFYGIKVVAAVVIFIVGRWVAKAIANLIKKLMTKSNTDETLVKFVGSLSDFALLAFVIIAALNQLGIQTTSFFAILGAAGLAIGLTLQGSLGNFAAGVLMIIFKPFKVGDFIEGVGVAGTVEEINIFTTKIVTPDNETIIVPNKKITAYNITNYTRKGIRRVDFVFGTGYGVDIDKARKIIEEIIGQDDRVLKDPKSTVAVSEVADSNVNFVANAWTSADDYWAFYFDTTEKVKKQFDAEGINISFPQRDSYIYGNKI